MESENTKTKKQELSSNKQKEPLASHPNHQSLHLLELQSSNISIHFDLVKELLNRSVTILKFSIIPLLPDHIPGHTQHHSMSLIHTIVTVTMRLNILQNRMPIASINRHIHPSHNTFPNSISIITRKKEVRMSFILLCTQNANLVTLDTYFTHPIISWQSSMNNQPSNKHSFWRGWIITYHFPPTNLCKVTS
ncbi:hypothetical protein MtrunA17_Chr7g0254041 [Medicago truncatula]|uniref:Uncharacterized protein n=1 Tax=Medicago truncatula TaxID=3880 RepID=Q2HRL6_MEDTR|nr:hypothetical protein MtrDRAFT_AC158465g10v2 [Medicago truncatula]RHN47536.1 hypothetical protein MtrunA17_Chr7g0254041 [Medicago truncatula]